MSYPSGDQVYASAQQLGIDPIVAFAYAAVHGVVPTGNSQLLTLQNQVQQMVNYLGSKFANCLSPQTLIYGYIQANLNVPSAYVFWQYALTQGWVYPQGGCSGIVPQPGQGYFAATGAPQQAGQPTTNPTPPPVDFLTSLSQHPLVLAGGVLIGGVAIYALAKR